MNTNKEGNMVFLELGVGMNTPVWVKYPFWQMTADNKKAKYICLNYGEVVFPREIIDCTSQHNLDTIAQFLNIIFNI